MNSEHDWRSDMSQANELWRQGDLEGARERFTRAVEFAPENEAMVYFSRARFFLEQKLMDEAIDDYSRAIEIMPHNEMFYVARAQSYEQAGRLAEAIEDCGSALKTARRPADLYHRRGRLYALLGQHEQAIADFNAAMQQSISHRHLIVRSASYEALRKIDLAIADLEAVIAQCGEDHPDSQHAREQITRLRSHLAKH